MPVQTSVTVLDAAIVLTKYNSIYELTNYKHSIATVRSHIEDVIKPFRDNVVRTSHIRKFVNKHLDLTSDRRIDKNLSQKEAINTCLALNDKIDDNLSPVEASVVKKHGIGYLDEYTDLELLQKTTGSKDTIYDYVVLRNFKKFNSLVASVPLAELTKNSRYIGNTNKTISKNVATAVKSVEEYSAIYTEFVKFNFLETSIDIAIKLKEFFIQDGEEDYSNNHTLDEIRRYAYDRGIKVYTNM